MAFTEAPSQSSQQQRLFILLLLALFVVVGAWWYWNADGEDLGSSFVGCRLLAAGRADALFNYDPDNFAGIGPGHIWQDFSKAGGFNGFIHPYVQTPLWGWGLKPLCTHVQWAWFNHLFVVLVMLCFAATVWLIARYWAPSLFRPLAIAVVLVGLFFAQPFQYAMFLTQTHALFFFLSVASLILAERERPVSAGFLLACAAAVKVTPGFLVIYWLLTRRWKAAVSMVAWSLAITVATVVIVGPHLFGVYLADLHRISRVLLVAENNQSFAAWWMGHFHPEDDVFDVDIFDLPTVLRWLSTALMIAFVAAGGWIDRQRMSLRREVARVQVPIGATMAMVAVTVFAPIAWTHYSVILVAPVMVIVEEARRLRSWGVGAWAVAIAALNYRPIATDIIAMDLGRFALLRGQFYAAVLCLGAVIWIWWERRRQGALRSA